MTATLRRLQQNAWAQALFATGVAFVGATIAALLAFSKGNIFNLGPTDLRAAVGMGGFAGLTYFYGVWQHGIGSVSFMPDGTPNRTVTDVVKVQAAAADGHPNLKAASAGLATQAAMVANQITQ